MPKKNYNIIWGVVLAIVIAFNLYVRLYPAWFPQLKEVAKAHVDKEIRTEILKDIKSSSPNLSAFVRNKIAKEKVIEVLKDKKNYREKVTQKYLSLKEPYQDENGLTYLQELDPFHWYRYTKLLLDNGFPGDRMQGNVIYDDYMLSPTGMQVPKNRGLFYLSAYLYKVWNFVDTDSTLKEFIFYLPVFFSLLWLISIFWVVKRYFSRATAVLAVFFAGGASIVLSRGAAGWYDMDMLSITFPLWIYYFNAKSLQTNLLKNIIYSLLAGFICGLYAYVWLGWIQVYCIMAFYFAYKFLNDYSLFCKQKDLLLIKLRQSALSFLFFYIGTAVIALYLRGEEPLMMVWSMVVSHLNLSDAASASIWPNTYFTVGELKKGDITNITRAMHGGWMFMLGLFSMALVYLREKRSEKADLVVPLILTFLLMFYASLKGVRFTLFLVTPLAIFLAEGFVVGYNFWMSKIHISRKLIRYPSLICLGFVIAFFSQSVITNSFALVSTIYPLIDDGFYNSLSYLKENTPKNSTINSWWDFGDWYKTVADRAVIFDGQSQRTANAFWMANIIYSQDDKMIENTLRMLNNSNYKLFDFVNQYIKDDFRCIAVLEKVLSSDTAKARLVLKNAGLSNRVIEKVINDVFVAVPAPAYFIVDKTMFPKTPQISFLGNWDYTKLYIKRNFTQPREELFKNVKEMFEIESDEFDRLYADLAYSESKAENNEVLSERYQFLGGLVKGKEEGGNIYFDNGLVIDLKSKTAKLHIPGLGFKVPKFLVVYDGQTINSYDLNKTSSLTDNELWQRGGVIVCKDEDEVWQTIAVTDLNLAMSMFVRLYLMDGHGLDQFKFFYQDDDAGIKVYEIDWSYKKDISL